MGTPNILHHLPRAALLPHGTVGFGIGVCVFGWDLGYSVVVSRVHNNSRSSSSARMNKEESIWHSIPFDSDLFLLFVVCCKALSSKINYNQLYTELWGAVIIAGPSAAIRN